MADLRQNPVTGRWIVVAPMRSARPMDAAGSGEGAWPAEARPSRDPDCPFCPGNEAELPEVRWELPDRDEPGWRCRAVPNRYPAFGSGEAAGTDAGITLSEEVDGPVALARSHPARGVQEVLIESPRHDRPPERMGDRELLAVARLYRERLEAVAGVSPGFSPVLFHNEGRPAGASLAHPHAQLVATEIPGPSRRILEERMIRFHRDAGECLLCRLPEHEPEGRLRIVEEDVHHRVYVPWAPEQAYEMWIVPKRHRSSFTDAEPGALDAWARILGRVLRRLRALLGEAAYQYVLHSFAANPPEPGALHWFVQVRPITGRRAGFEVATGIGIDPASPEDAAERLRAADPTPITGGAS